MIDLVFCGNCNKCPFADLELESMEYTDYRGQVTTKWTVKCKHEIACDELWKQGYRAGFKDCEKGEDNQFEE